MKQVRIKTHLSLIFGMILCIGLSGCSSSNWRKENMEEGVLESAVSKEVTMEAKKSPISPTEKRVNFILLNQTNQELAYGPEPFLEVQLDNIWYVVPYKEGGGGSQLNLFVIGAKETRPYNLDLESNYDPLPPGHYRCIVKFEEGFAASGEFDVS